MIIRTCKNCFLFTCTVVIRESLVNIYYVLYILFRINSRILVVMVALCNRADHNIFMLFLLLLLFFPRLISAVGDWMFTILWHMVWP